MGICDGRVVVITGAGRGIGREHAIAYAREGAKIVVNDLGGEMDGTGSSTGPAGEVVDEIRGMDIVICTTAKTDNEARELLRGFDMPFQQ